jgi:hypothetical protein
VSPRNTPKQKSTNRYDTEEKRTQKDKFTPAQIFAALKASGGVNSAAARMLRCSPSTIANYVARFPEIAEAKKEIEQRYLDVAETIVVKRMTSPNSPAQQLRAAIYYLQRKGTSRGYGKSRRTTCISNIDLEGKRLVDLSRLSAEEQAMLKRLLDKATIEPDTP